MRNLILLSTVVFISATTLAIDYTNTPAISSDQAPTICPAVCHKNCAIWVGPVSMGHSTYNQGRTCSCDSLDNYWIAFEQPTQALRYVDSKPVDMVPINTDIDAVNECPGICHQYSGNWTQSHFVPGSWSGKYEKGTDTSPAICQCQMIRRKEELSPAKANTQVITIQTQPAQNICQAAGLPETKAQGEPYGSTYVIEDEKAAEIICPALCKSFNKVWTKYWSNQQAARRPVTKSECGCKPEIIP